MWAGKLPALEQLPSTESDDDPAGSFHQSWWTKSSTDELVIVLEGTLEGRRLNPTTMSAVLGPPPLGTDRRARPDAFSETEQL